MEGLRERRKRESASKVARRFVVMSLHNTERFGGEGYCD